MKSRMRLKVSAPMTSTRRAWPDWISALALASAKTKPAQTAWTSKAKPEVMPILSWIIVAADGKVRSAVEVARISASRSAAPIPASASAAVAAFAPRSEVVSPSAAKWRRSIPVRVRIHSSLVSTHASNSEFGTTRAGK